MEEEEGKDTKDQQLGRGITRRSRRVGNCALRNARDVRTARITSLPLAYDLHAISPPDTYRWVSPRRKGIGSEFVFAKRDPVFFVLFEYFRESNKIRIRGKKATPEQRKTEGEELSLSRNYLFFPERRRFLENVQKQIEFRESWKRARFSDTKILDSLPLIYHPIFECGAFQSRLKFTQQPAAALDLIQWRGRSRVDGNRDKQLPLTTTPSDLLFLRSIPSFSRRVS